MTGYVCHYSFVNTTPEEEARWGKEPGYFESLRSQAARQLSNNVIREASVYERKDPLPEKPWGHTEHRWWIAVAGPGDILGSLLEAREEGRKAGLAAASEALRVQAQVYVALSGGCARVIASELTSRAEAINKL